MMSRTILITGAAGRIGSWLTRDLAGRYDLALTDIHPPEDTRGLAADPAMDATWESLLPRNIVGLYNIFQAAHEAGCRRVIFASSVNAVFGYPKDMQVHTTMPVRPLNLYGASKAWGEAVACFYADQRGFSAICLRFGWVISRDSEQLRPDHPYLDIALTYEDLTRLVVASIDAPDTLRFGVFHGVSNNRWKRLDISDARRVLGYAPEDDAFALAGVMRDA
jgi:nucleoside-diphosphate-sugar epimerase